MEGQKRVFCTVFDKNYLYQGVALYRSLIRHSPNFVLYCLALDDLSVEVLEAFQFPHLKVVPLSKLNQTWVQTIKPLTSYGQFCWSMQPVLCHYILEQCKESDVTYIEADSWFFSSPEPLFLELTDDSVSLAPHWFSPQFEYLGKESGIYCTHFNFFRNDKNGRDCLEFWRQQNFEYRKERPYSVPGQFCLNFFQEKFKGVHVLKNRGAGVAPWNIQSYSLSTLNGAPQVNGTPVIFYHFHQLGTYLEDSFDLGTYPFSKKVIDIFYGPYVRELISVERQIRDRFPSFDFKKRIQPAPSLIQSILTGNITNLKKAIHSFKRRFFGNDHIIKIEDFLKEDPRK